MRSTSHEATQYAIFSNLLSLEIGTSTIRRVKSQKNAYLIYPATEAWNHLFLHPPSYAQTPSKAPYSRTTSVYVLLLM